MTALATGSPDAAAPAYREVTFDRDGETRLFGWFHAPRASIAKRCGVVLCNPFAEAALSVHRVYRVLAERFAAAGYPTLRFDYDGTGDSAGSDDDPERWAAWMASVHAAIETCRQQGEVDEVALFGLRLGGTLAVMAAEQRDDVVALMLWAPVVNGRKFVRELRMLQATSAASLAAKAGLATPALPFDGLEAAGFRHSAKTIADISGINLLKRPPAPIPTLLLDRDDVGADTELGELWSSAGVPLEDLSVPGYSGMMRDAQYSVVPGSAIEALLEWMGRTRPAPAIGASPVAPSSMQPMRTPPPVAGDSAVTVTELPVWFGADGELFGILSRPEKSASALADTAAIVLSAGGNHRIGPSRLSVPIARYLASLGCSALRMDFAGLGDSRPVFEQLPIFDVSSVADVRHALDFLSGLAGTPIRRFVVIGLCSGGFITMHTALADPRVNSQVIMNLPAFEATEANSPERVAKRYIKPLRFYVNAVTKRETWRRALHGNIDFRRVVVGVSSRFLKRAAVQQRALMSRLLMIRDRSIAARFRRLGRRNVMSLVILSANDGAVDEMETHLGKNASKMRNEANFRLVTLSGADHTFTSERARKDLLGALRGHFEALAQKLPAGVLVP